MARIRMTAWILAAALLAAVPAAAETFHSQDGVVFEGTLRKVVPQAAVCNVFEENHPPDEYERLKPNHGQPLDLWQVDFAVRNESRRQIEHLRASGWVRAEHPPCTNWSGEGPGGGSLLPQPSLLVPAGVAIHNLESSPGLVRCDLMREGVLLDAATIPLEANGQTSWLIDQTFPAADTSDFTGSVRCDAVGEGRFSAVALEMDPATRTFTTLPVVPVPERASQE